MTLKEDFADEAWEIARKVAAIDGQLLSSQAVEAFAALAALAEQRAALRCAEIAGGHTPFLNDGIDGKLIATAIRREFGLSTPESDSTHGTTQPEPRCPTCGYTKYDSAIWGDHNLCPGKIPTPESAKKNVAGGNGQCPRLIVGK